MTPQDIDQAEIDITEIVNDPRPWYQHKRTQGRITAVVGAVLFAAKVSNPIIGLVGFGLGAIWEMIGHVNAGKRQVEATKIATVVQAKAIAAIPKKKG